MTAGISLIPGKTGAHRAPLQLKRSYFIGLDPPLSSVLPLGNFTERPLATGPPNFARKPLTTTSSPAGIVSFFQPSLKSALGAPSSKRQLVTLPSGSVTST